MDTEKLRITTSDEYKTYISALSLRASTWIPKIRKQYAVKAFELFSDPSIRKLVIAYGEEMEKLRRDRLRDFETLANDPGRYDFLSLEDSCLINASEYGKAIDLLFDIKL